MLYDNDDDDDDDNDDEILPFVVNNVMSMSYSSMPVHSYAFDHVITNL